MTGAPPWVLPMTAGGGPCVNQCGATITRYGPDAGGTLCLTCAVLVAAAKAAA